MLTDVNNRNRAEVTIPLHIHLELVLALSLHDTELATGEVHEINCSIAAYIEETPYTFFHAALTRARPDVLAIAGAACSL